LVLKHILLVGSGHSHLEVLKNLSRDEISAHHFTLISPETESYYSGLLPRLIMGDISTENLILHSAQFAESKGVKFIKDRLISFHSGERKASFESGLELKFDILSIDIGGEPQKMKTEDPINPVSLKPISGFVRRWPDIQQLFTGQVNPSFVVVGGGPASVEIATALKIRLNRNQAPQAPIHLVTQSERLCQNYSEKISAQILKSLQKISVQVHFNEKVSHIYSNYILLSSSEKLKFNKIFLALPNENPEMIKKKINNKLMLEENIFAVGDCVQMSDYPKLPRSGVTAVRQGQHLAENLKKLLRGEKLDEFNPAKHQLNILISSSNQARLIRGSLNFEGKIAFQLKNYIDSKYIFQFNCKQPAP
jgi:selenide, water dikinase